MTGRHPRTPPARPRRKQATTGPRAASHDPSPGGGGGGGGDLATAEPEQAEAGSALAGQVLIATPSMGDERFSQSVILLCMHSEQGAMGIVLNRPLRQPSFTDLLKQLEVAPNPPARSIELTAGGPMDSARGFVLHTDDWTGENSMPVEPGLALTASLDVLKALAEGGGPRQGLLALGYAGWGPGQLDGELRTNTWLLAPSDPGLLFDADHASKWRRAMAKLKVDPLLLSSVAGHA